LIVVAYGGPEDPDYNDNGAVVLLTPSLARAMAALSADAVEQPAQTVTAIVTETVAETVTAESTVTVLSGNTTVTLEKISTLTVTETEERVETVTKPLEGLGIGLDARDAFLVLLALLILAAIIRLLK
jgi:hypothetical protein